MGTTVSEVGSREILVGILEDLDAEHRDLMRLAIESATNLDVLSESQLACAVQVHRWAIEEGLINFDGELEPAPERERSHAAAGMESLASLVRHFRSEPDAEEVVEHLLAWLDAGVIDPGDFEESLVGHLDLLSLTRL
jgi:hypothetical protein